MSDIAIKVENLSKLYKIGARQQGYKTLRESIMGTLTAPFRRFMQKTKCKAPKDALHASNPFDSRPNTLLSAPCPVPSSSDDIIWALKDVSFEVKRGEVVGVIGRNGAGKTTLLKILSRITEPTEGRAEIHGRVGSLLEVGTGFHPELTGRENIYLNGAILGMRKAEIEQKFDEIVGFAEIEKFIDTPVKRYSSGMYVRLAFAVAAHLEPEILLVDEVLAVGDAEFQRKCLGKMDEISKVGRTVVLVSHNMAAIESLCKRAILLESGQIKKFASAAEVVSAYLFRPTKGHDFLTTANERMGSGKARVSSISYCSQADQNITIVRCGDCLKIKVEYMVFERLIAPVFRMTLYTSRGVPVANFDSGASGVTLSDSKTRCRIVCEVNSLNLSPGLYYINVGIADATGLVDHVVQGAPLTIEASDFLGSGKLPDPRAGLVVFRARWRFESAGEALY